MKKELKNKNKYAKIIELASSYLAIFTALFIASIIITVLLLPLEADGEMYMPLMKLFTNAPGLMISIFGAIYLIIRLCSLKQGKIDHSLSIHCFITLGIIAASIIVSGIMCVNADVALYVLFADIAAVSLFELVYLYDRVSNGEIATYLLYNTLILFITLNIIAGGMITASVVYGNYEFILNAIKLILFIMSCALSLNLLLIIIVGNISKRKYVTEDDKEERILKLKAEIRALNEQLQRETTKVQ